MATPVPELRGRLVEAIEAREYEDATSLLLELLRQPLTSSLARFATARMDEFSRHVALQRVKVFLLRSFTIEPLVPLLRSRCFSAGLDAEVTCGDFGTFAQELLDPKSRLFEFSPDIVVFATATRDLLPNLWKGINQQEWGVESRHVEESFETWLTNFRRHSKAHLIVFNFELPPSLARGIHNAQIASNARDTVWELNRRLTLLVNRLGGMSVVDYHGLVEHHGVSRWHDRKGWLLGRMPIAATQMIDLADELMRFIYPITNRTAKALVVDLDNTLWGGVVGEDGIEGLQIGIEYPGVTFHEFQNALLTLRERGILLAICSKNNPSDALQALNEHPDMLLREKHFSAIRINWNDKASNIIEIANELSIGLDSIAFLDDSDFERAWIRSKLPEVRVLDFPNDLLQLAASVLTSPLFERLKISKEDRHRNRYYAEERKRTELQQSATSVSDFLETLRIEVEPIEPDALTFGRLAQLTQKTNQFNLTTRRLQEHEIQKLSKSPDTRVVAVRVRDRFGDNGIVGLAIGNIQPPSADLAVFLLSCRVIGRGVETALFCHFAQQLISAGVETLTGTFIPTKKNGPAASFFRKHGFVQIRSQGLDQRWQLNLEAQPKMPRWISFKSQT